METSNLLSRDTCKEIETINKMYSDQATFAYGLIVMNVFIFSLLFVLVP